MSDSLHDFYTERAALAYAIEHTPDGAAFLPEYQMVDAHLRVHEQTFAQAWTWPRAGGTRLPWCSVCGSREYALAVGQSYCVQCAMLVAPDEARRPGPLTDDDLMHAGEGTS